MTLCVTVTVCACDCVHSYFVCSIIKKFLVTKGVQFYNRIISSRNRAHTRTDPRVSQLPRYHLNNCNLSSLVCELPLHHLAAPRFYRINREVTSGYQGHVVQLTSPSDSKLLMAPTTAWCSLPVSCAYPYESKLPRSERNFSKSSGVTSLTAIVLIKSTRQACLNSINFY